MGDPGHEVFRDVFLGSSYGPGLGQLRHELVLFVANVAVGEFDVWPALARQLVSIGSISGTSLSSAWEVKPESWEVDESRYSEVCRKSVCRKSDGGSVLPDELESDLELLIEFIELKNTIVRQLLYGKERNIYDFMVTKFFTNLTEDFLAWLPFLRLPFAIATCSSSQFCIW